MKWTKEQQERFEKFILGDDMDFYEEYTIHLMDEEQKNFFEENPEFMSEYSISRDMLHLLRDPIYRGLMRKIKKYETGDGVFFQFVVCMGTIHWLRDKK